MGGEDPVAAFRASLADGYRVQATAREEAAPDGSGKVGRLFTLKVYGPEGREGCGTCLWVEDAYTARQDRREDTIWGILVRSLGRGVAWP